MHEYEFVLVNVFAETHFGGNPLAVFPQAEGLDDETMQQIARQFNLSETAFAFPSESAAADLRIFTPAHELPLAGHPILGSASVLQQQQGLPENFVLNTRAKPVYLSGSNNTMTLKISGYTCRPSSASRVELAEAAGICEAEIAEHAYWLDSGSPQLLLQVYTAAALENARIDYAKLNAVCRADSGRTMIYLWHEQGDTVQARMFYAQNGTILEDSGTGSACANLGAYYLFRGTFPRKRSVRQGDQTGRPNRLSLRVDEAENIYVGGCVVEVGRGMFKLPS